MKRTVLLWELFGFAVTSFLGTILHFMYEWLGEAVWIAPFSGVNESTWEHMKLLFWPMLLFLAVQSIFFRDYDSFICVKLRGILIGLCLIPTLFYLYNGVIGESPDFINIAIFFVSAGVGYLYETKELKSDSKSCNSPKRAWFALGFIALLFIAFTFYPPHLEIFRDPITGGYGI